MGNLLIKSLVVVAAAALVFAGRWPHALGFVAGVFALDLGCWLYLERAGLGQEMERLPMAEAHKHLVREMGGRVVGDVAVFDRLLSDDERAALSEAMGREGWS